MRSFKRLLMLALVVGGLGVSTSPPVNAAPYYRRVAPVRRAVLPPYPVARRAFYGPVYRPWVGPYGYGYGGPVVYGPGVSVAVGW
jgi:hypothetical protein